MDPAAKCAVVPPEAPTFYGIAGQDMWGQIPDMGTWYGKKTLKCVEESKGECVARNLTTSTRIRTPRNSPGSGSPVLRGPTASQPRCSSTPTPTPCPASMTSCAPGALAG